MTIALRCASEQVLDFGFSYFTIKSIWSKLSHYKILDKYPPSMEAKIRAIQTAITSDLYQFMTNSLAAGELNTMAARFNVEVVACRSNLVIALPHHPNYVLKSSSNGLYEEITHFGNCMPLGMNYSATNSEGGVSPLFFGLAERVAFSQHLRHIIQKHKLDMIKVPKKFLVSFPQQLVPYVAVPLHNKRVFVISKRYEIDFNAPMILDDLEQEELVRQLKILFENAKGILDIHGHNLCFKEKKILFFDTEKFHLDPFCRVCISAPLKEVRIGLENMRIYFNNLPEEKGKKLSSLCLKEIEEIKRKERVLLITRISISIIFVTFAYISLQYVSSILVLKPVDSEQ